jgi:phosphonate transport system substrate-binding protein
MRLLVTPQVYPEGPIYYAYFIVPADSPARSLVDLQDQRFAFSDPLSLSGTLFLMHELIKIGKRPESFFKLTIFTNSHNASVEAVADKLVDGASVMSSIWDYLAATDPALVAKTKIIHKSGQLSMGPVVVGTHVDPQLVRKLTDAFLKMDQDAAGAVVLGKLRFLKFVKVQDSFYDRVRNIQLFVNNGLYPYSIAKEVNKLNR